MNGGSRGSTYVQALQGNPERPWRGVGPIQSAALAGRLSASTIRMLADEAGGPRGYLLPLPQNDGMDGSVDSLKGDIRTLTGSVALVESTLGSWNTDNAAGRRDWAKVRLGAEPPSALVEQAALASREILAACGVSPALFDAKSATGSREAWRQLLFGVVAPIGRLVEHELQAKLHPDLALTWDELLASDIQGRARVFQSLTGGGMDAGKAQEIVGFDS